MHAYVLTEVAGIPAVVVAGCDFEVWYKTFLS